MSQHIVVLLLGTNLGDKKKNLISTLELIEESVGTVVKKTKYLETKPIDFVSYNNFINFAIALRTLFSPMEVLGRVKEIERKLGRIEDSKVLGGYQDRIIDIDIVSFNNLTFSSNRLNLPHQEHLKRDFSIELLKELNEQKHKI